MRDGISQIKITLSWHFLLEDILIIEGDYASIFHSTTLVLMNEYLIVFIETKFIPKERLKKLHGLDGYLKYELGHLFQKLEQ